MALPVRYEQPSGGGGGEGVALSKQGRSEGEEASAARHKEREVGTRRNEASRESESGSIYARSRGMREEAAKLEEAARLEKAAKREEEVRSDEETATRDGMNGQTAGDLLELPEDGVRVKIPAEAGVSFAEYQRMHAAMLDMVSLVGFLADQDVRDTKVHRTGRSLDHIIITRSSYGSPNEVIAAITDVMGFIASHDVKIAVGLVGGLFLGKLPGAWKSIQDGLLAREQRLDSSERRGWDRLDRERAEADPTPGTDGKPSSDITQVIPPTEPEAGAVGGSVPSVEQVRAFGDLVDIFRDEFGGNPTRQQRKLLQVVSTAHEAYAEGRLPNELQVLYSAMLVADRGGVVDQGGAATTPEGEAEQVLVEPEVDNSGTHRVVEAEAAEGEQGMMEA